MPLYWYRTKNGDLKMTTIKPTQTPKEHLYAILWELALAGHGEPIETMGRHTRNEIKARIDNIVEEIKQWQH